MLRHIELHSPIERTATCANPTIESAIVIIQPVVGEGHAPSDFHIRAKGVGGVGIVFCKDIDHRVEQLIYIDVDFASRFIVGDLERISVCSILVFARLVAIGVGIRAIATRQDIRSRSTGSSQTRRSH